MTVTPDLPTTLSTRGARVSEMGYLFLKTHHPVKAKESYAKFFDIHNPKKSEPWILSITAESGCFFLYQIKRLR
jgi:hypothetical protein